MDYQVSARKWRPQTFEEVIGQEHVTTSLANAIRLDKIAQAYLFSGIRGVGKTSLARILAKGINCEKLGTTVPCNKCEQCSEITGGRSVDVVEVDGASNTGVDDVRELRENVKYLPLRARYKIYIIDEVHMLSNAAFNALLKTLEEPPPHLIFILATTESHKIPATILSRCQHFTFSRMTLAEIVAQLRCVAEERQCVFSEKGLHLIGRLAEGSMRDALSVLDQAISFGGEQVSDEDLFTLMGRMHASTFQAFVHAIHKKDTLALLTLAKEVSEQGCDLTQFLSDCLEHLRNLIVTQNLSEVGDWVDLPAEEIEEIRIESALFSPEALQRLFSIFARLQREIRHAPQPFLLFEVTLMKSILLADLQPIEAMITKLDALASGSPAPRSVGKTPEDIKDPQAIAMKTVFKKPVFEQSIAIEKKTALASPSKPSPAKPSPSWLAALAEKKGSKVPLSKSRSQIENPAPKNIEKTNAKITSGPAQETWQKLLSAIKEERPNIASYLKEGDLISLSDQEIQMGFSGDSIFLMPLIQKESSREWMNDFLKTYFKRDVSLLLLERGTTKKGPEPAFKPIPSYQKPPVFEGNQTLPSKHPFVQEILDVMGGSVIETK